MQHIITETTLAELKIMEQNLTEERIKVTQRFSEGNDKQRRFDTRYENLCQQFHHTTDTATRQALQACHR